MKHNVLVAGGGIGGLACALALGRAGVPVTVLEQAQAFGEIGAGIQLGPNAMRVLSDWGVADALQALCVQQGLQAPDLSFGHWQAPPPQAKRRRLLMLQLPEGLPCVY